VNAERALKMSMSRLTRTPPSPNAPKLFPDDLIEQLLAQVQNEDHAAHILVIRVICSGLLSMLHEWRFGMNPPIARKPSSPWKSSLRALSAHFRIDVNEVAR
jgi:hypothetical protein